MTSSTGSDSATARHHVVSRAAVLVAVVMAVLFVPVIAVFSADVPIATIPVGEAPQAVGVNPISHRVYVANYYGDSVSIIDGNTDSVVATVPTGYFSIPVAVLPNPFATPARAYAANFWANTLTVIDESTSEVTATVPSNGTHAGGPRALALNPTGPVPKLYVAEYGSGMLTVRNANTYEEITHFYTGDAARALGIFASASRTRIYVVNRGVWTLSIIDGDTDTIIKTLPLQNLPKAVAVDNSTGYAYVTNEGANSVTVVDDTDNIATTLATGARPIGIAVDEAGGRLFVANNDGGSVSVFRTSDHTLEATVAVGADPWAIAFDAGDRKAFVTNFTSNTTSVIDENLNVTNVPCGSGPLAVAVDEGQIPHKTYVGNWNSNTVTVIDEPLAATTVSMLGVAEANAAEEPIIVTIDEPDTSGGTTIVSGSATSNRPVYPAAMTAVFYRLAPDQSWTRAAITAGEGTSDVEWEADLGVLADGTYDIEVIGMDQTSAAASVSDDGAATRASSAGGSAALSFEIGAAIELHETTTELEVERAKGASALEAEVECDEECGDPTGQLVFEKLVGSTWTTVATETLDDGEASYVLTRGTRGEFRARYLGDDAHEPSVSDSVLVGPGRSADKGSRYYRTMS